MTWSVCVCVHVRSSDRVALGLYYLNNSSNSTNSVINKRSADEKDSGTISQMSSSAPKRAKKNDGLLSMLECLKNGGKLTKIS